MRFLLPPLLLISSLLTSNIASANMAPEVNRINEVDKQTSITIKKQVTYDIARTYDAYSSNLKRQINEYQLAVDFDESVTGTHKKTAKLKEKLSRSNRAIRKAKEMNVKGENLIQLRMASKKMLRSWQNGKEPLFAFAPAGDDKTWTTVEAYDKNGKLYSLDAYTLPDRPVFVVELNGKKSLREGVRIMRNVLSSNGMEKTVAPRTQPLMAKKAQQISAHVLKYIRLSYDAEPWVSGKAEVYAITTGVSPSRKAPVIDIADMPYLDHQDTDYRPNQILIHWNRYRWEAADVVLMEHDENTNYKTLAQNLLIAAEQIMNEVPNEEVQDYTFITKITSSLLDSMPDQWFINTDDYLDTFYTLLESESYTNHYGANGNAKITFEPLHIDER